MGREIVAGHWINAREDCSDVGLVGMSRRIAEHIIGVHTVL